MAYEKNLSPVGWYVASYLLRFVELNDASRNDPEKKFAAWENTVLVQAESMDEAFSKAQKIARSAAKPYRGGPDGVPANGNLWASPTSYPSTSSLKTAQKSCGKTTALGS